MNPELPLRDIHLPVQPSWWPPAPGWWLLTVVMLIVLWLFGRWALRYVRSRRRWRALQAEFEQAASQSDPRSCLIAVSDLLRRAARQRDPTAAVLSGSAWIAFLDRHLPAQAPAGFGVELGQLLLDGAYRPALDAAAVQSLLTPARQCYLNMVRGT